MLLVKQVNKQLLINGIKAIPDKIINLIIQDNDSQIKITGKDSTVTINSNIARRIEK